MAGKKTPRRLEAKRKRSAGASPGGSGGPSKKGAALETGETTARRRQPPPPKQRPLRRPDGGHGASTTLRGPEAPATAATRAPFATVEPDEKEILEERGEVEQNLVEIAARDSDRTPEDEEALARERERKPDTFYSDLIYTLANIRYPEDEARLVWVNLLTHKAEMSQLLGRNVGIRVAALDFFRNVLGNLGDVKIVDSSEYIQTARLAVTDGLTGVHNHRYFQDRLARSLERASREHVPVSLLMIDIDHFKRYNDRFGHIAGDVALREVAATLRRLVDREQTLSRYGGEEFTAILFGVDKAEALREAERLRKEIEALSFPGESEMRDGWLTISVGVATFPEDASDRNGLIDWADLSLYLAKTGGRNRAVSCPIDRRRVGRYHAGLDVRLRHDAAGAAPYDRGSPSSLRSSATAGSSAEATEPSEAFSRRRAEDGSVTPSPPVEPGARSQARPCYNRSAPSAPPSPPLEGRPARPEGPSGSKGPSGLAEAYRKFRVADIGVGGVALVGKQLPSSGSRVSVLLSGGGIKEPLTIEGRVAWRRSESRLGELAGVEFVGMSADAERELARLYDRASPSRRR